MTDYNHKIKWSCNDLSVLLTFVLEILTCYWKFEHLPVQIIKYNNYIMDLQFFCNIMLITRMCSKNRKKAWAIVWDDFEIYIFWAPAFYTNQVLIILIFLISVAFSSVFQSIKILNSSIIPYFSNLLIII